MLGLGVNQDLQDDVQHVCTNTEVQAGKKRQNDMASQLTYTINTKQVSRHILSIHIMVKISTLTESLYH